MSTQSIPHTRIQTLSNLTGYKNVTHDNEVGLTPYRKATLNLTGYKNVTHDNEVGLIIYHQTLFPNLTGYKNVTHVNMVAFFLHCQAPSQLHGLQKCNPHQWRKVVRGGDVDVKCYGL